jgi:RNA polymerase sigma-70 factor (ECF subfamily)
MNKRDLDSSIEKLTVLRAQAREAGAFEQLVRLYERRMLYYVHRLLGNDFDRADVLQEIWLKVFLKIPSLRAPEAFRVWLYKIAHDVAVSQLRKNSRLPTPELPDENVPDDSVGSTEDELELLEDASQVHLALAKLSLPHREVLTLRFLEGLDLSEIAEVTDTSLGTVKSRLHYAKFEMRRLLETPCHE